MTTKLLARINLDLLYPPFMYKVIELVGKCHDLGSDYYATSGYRTPEEQLALYAKGRNEAGKVVDPKAVVTNNMYGAHNAAVACDLTYDSDLTKEGLQPNWIRKNYDLLSREAEKLGLESGHRWLGFPDSPHVQLPLKKKGIYLHRLRRMDQKTLWAFLDKYSW